MKMKKSILAILLCAVMALLASCGDNSTGSTTDGSSQATVAKTALELYNLANEKVASAQTVKSKVETKLTMTVAGQQMETLTTGYVDVKTGDKPALASVMTTSFMGTSTDVSQCLIDGTYYVSTMGNTVKAPIGDQLDALLQKNDQTMDLSGLEILSDDQSMTDGENGDKIVTFNLNAETLSKLTSDALANTLGDMGEGSNMNMNSMKVTATIGSDGVIKNTNITMDFKMTIEGDEVACVMEMVIEYEFPGDDYTISAPEGMDLQNATESDLSTMLAA